MPSSWHLGNPCSYLTLASFGLAQLEGISSSKLTWQWKMDLFEDVFLIEAGYFSIAMLVKSEDEILNEIG